MFLIASFVKSLLNGTNVGFSLQQRSSYARAHNTVLYVSCRLV